MNELLVEVAEILKRGPIVDPVSEAERIVRTAFELGSEDGETIAKDMAKRRAAGVPLAHVVGRERFMGIELIVADGVLAPRHETELLGNAVLDVMRASGSTEPRIIDMCCGSGNLACAIAHHLPSARVWASDLTNDCVALARANAEHVHVADRVTVTQGDLFGGLAGLGLEGVIDAVVCNPPYISKGKLSTDRAELLEHEPREAFDGGAYGLSIHQRVIKEALPFLRPGGMLLFEIGLGQERQVSMLFDRAKAYDGVRAIANAAGELRVVSGRKLGV